MLSQCQERNLFHLDSASIHCCLQRGGISVTTEDDAIKTRTLIVNAGIWCIPVCSTSKIHFVNVSPRTKVLYLFYRLVYRNTDSKKPKNHPKANQKTIPTFHLALKPSPGSLDQATRRASRPTGAPAASAARGARPLPSASALPHTAR